MSTSTEVARFDPASTKYPVLFHQEGDGSFAEVMEDNFGDEGFSAADLPRVVTPSGGGQAWDIPNRDPAKEIVGVVVHKQPTRSMWWAKRGDGEDGDGPPDCASSDAKVGIGAFGTGSKGNPTGLCSECPMSQFGSADDGKGQKCKAKMELYVLQSGSTLPIHVTLPPTSLKPWRKYMTALLTDGIAYMTVVTRLGLTKAKGPAGDYSVVDPKLGEPLAAEEAQAARAYGQIIKAYLEKSDAERDDARERAVAEAREGEPADA